jgi:hypothetical protein
MAAAAKFAHTLAYVPDIAASVEFIERAFGHARRFLVPTGDNGERETRETALAFAQHATARANPGHDHVDAHASTQPLDIEIGLVTDAAA